jgi:hypothetical protein
MAGSSTEAIFKWETLLEVAVHVLQYKKPVAGKMCSIELTSGTSIHVWRADDGQSYFCHGLTFGGRDAPGGAISPYTGVNVEAILRDYYERIAESQSTRGDIVVWKGLAPETTPHSAILADVLLSGEVLHPATVLQTKNGMDPEEAWTLKELFDQYGESFNVFRRK